MQQQLVEFLLAYQYILVLVLYFVASESQNDRRDSLDSLFGHLLLLTLVVELGVGGYNIHQAIHDPNALGAEHVEVEALHFLKLSLRAKVVPVDHPGAVQYVQPEHFLATCSQNGQCANLGEERIEI